MFSHSKDQATGYEMKKIMFDDRHGLTKAVLEGRKTMTRRIVNFDRVHTLIPGRIAKCCLMYAPYKVGEVVAVAQSYKNLNEDGFVPPEWLDHTCESSAGYNNKMFVRADLMPERNLIRITNIRVERLQDISDEDCLREGIFWDYGDYPYMATKMYKYNEKEEYIHPKAAFAALIDKALGKGTWKSNPWVFVYEFSLVEKLCQQ